ncbi:1-acyl-sn-glycerol-3-phosphate acyltransferase [Mucilaginibacter ginkgonis]|uniref:1-acyl-sn-glycerol-3-phosphate acyltransferase n=1 Tax=Mucilaginibacter ginkgonis TaxID=2682091 RepID=A0A6I4I7T2_9SPHI|nr:1-acyl-sn-glycerol-3-phosphate acyltransferase [Mucilaginibacter ginkgonis]QQL49242.1 1-acyl-sn-glycerol-3-phosphate acyltransferase [Mucilaginibacter ginkgonis]
MIKPARNIFISTFFERYISFILSRDFQKINVNSIEVSRDKSVLLLANHYSWWDGFIAFYINKKLFKKKAHVMIIETTARKYAFMKYLGAYTVNKGTRDMITSLDYTAELLTNPANLVLLFPQGKIYSNFADSVVFSKGLSRIIEKVTGKFEIVYAASFTETLHHKKPTVNVALKKAKALKFEGMEQEYNAFYKEVRDRQSKIVI